VECRLHSTVRLGDSTVVFGRVELISVWESAVEDGRPRIERLKPLARLGGRGDGRRGVPRQAAGPRIRSVSNPNRASTLFQA
jgi:flavin reductase (DIM6/NTAB) family NADH-FMN oxidoreductase RutF